MMAVDCSSMIPIQEMPGNIPSCPGKYKDQCCDKCGGTNYFVPTESTMRAMNKKFPGNIINRMRKSIDQNCN